LAAKAALVPRPAAFVPPLPHAPAPPPAPPSPVPPPVVLPTGPLLTCRVCGCQTRDWVVLYGNTGQCRCRACTR
jgi:hypothetical protein